MSVIADLIRAGVDPELVARVVEWHETELKELFGNVRGQNADIERRRAADRERKRAKRACEMSARNSADKSPNGSDKESPQTPKETTSLTPFEKPNGFSSSTVGNQEKSKQKKVRSSVEIELVDRMTDEWNSIARDFHLASVKVITPPREAAVLARAKELVGCYDFPDPISGFNAWANKIRGSPFLRGETGWKPNFDFAVKPQFFTRIMEGAYDDAEKNRNERFNSHRVGGNNRT